MLFLPQLTSDKKRKFAYLLVGSLVVIIIIWFVWVSKFGYTRSDLVSEGLFGKLNQRSQEAAVQFNIFRDQMQNNWQQLEDLLEQEKKREAIITEMKSRLSEVAVTSTTTTEPIESEQTIEKLPSENDLVE